ncbi:MAG: acyl carrier protein [Gemmatimonadaceae bacterium]
MKASTETDVIARVRTFIQENFLYMRPNFEVGPDDGLLEQGIIDSMGVLDLLNFLEEAFDVRVSDDELTEENLGTLRSIGRFVAAKRQSVGAD